MSEPTKPILSVKNLKQHFKVNRKFTVKAVDGVSLTSTQVKLTDWLENPAAGNRLSEDR